MLNYKQVPYLERICSALEQQSTYLYAIMKILEKMEKKKRV